MNDTLTLVNRLRRTAERISEWRANAARFRATMGLTSIDETLDMDRIIAAIQRETAAFDELVADIEQKSRGASGDMAELRETLRLLLMDFTELREKAATVRPRTVAAVPPTELTPAA